MTNKNNDATPQLELGGTGSENGREPDQSLNDQSSTSRQFGSTNLWSIRRNARKFRIHERMPRL